MKYLTYLISLLFVLAFVGCNKTKDTAADVKQTKTEAVEEALETVEDTTGEATEAVEEVAEEAEEAVKEVTE